MAGEFIQRSRHGTVFYFRRRIPHDLRAVLGRREVVFSLGTEERQTARRIARVLAVKTDELFWQLRNPSLAKEDLPRLAENKFREMGRLLLAADYIGGSANYSENPPMNTSASALQFGYGLTFELNPHGQSKLQFSDVKPGDEAAVEDAARRVLALAKPSAVAPPDRPSPTVAEAIQAVLASPDIKASTKKEYRRGFQFFAAFVGHDTRLHEIQAERFAEFADHVRAQPDWSAKTQVIYITTAQRLFTFFASRCRSVPKIVTAGLKPKLLNFVEN